MKPTRVVIIGRPNVGKSTLFNRLLGRRRALVHDEPGVTRDRLEEKTDWWVRAKKFPVALVDTGGLGGERFANEIEKQVKIALSEADVVLMVFDGQSGLTPYDSELIRSVKMSGIHKKIPVIGVVNKIDAEKHEEAISEFLGQGMDPVLTVSAEHRRGIEGLKETVTESVSESESESVTEPQHQENTETESVPRIAIVGRPNVGKSTFVNALLGKERMITSPIAGTTVDAVDSTAILNGKPFILIDTAGIRRKSKTEQGVEVLSVVQAKKALERADVAILLLDGEKGITDQDEKIGGIIEKTGCGVVLAINKWDTQKQNRKFTKESAAKRIRSQMAYLKYAPILFMSAAEKTGYEDLGDLVEEIIHQRRIKIHTHEFTEWVRKESAIHNPRNAKFYLCHQTGKNPPTFLCHVNDVDRVHFSLKRHLVNALRERWGFMGNPVRMSFTADRAATK